MKIEAKEPIEAGDLVTMDGRVAGSAFTNGAWEGDAADIIPSIEGTAAGWAFAELERLHDRLHQLGVYLPRGKLRRLHALAHERSWGPMAPWSESRAWST